MFNLLWLGPVGLTMPKCLFEGAMVMALALQVVEDKSIKILMFFKIFFIILNTITSLPFTQIAHTRIH
ncbi:hypothetical protein HanIR_Chr16g0823941 [Helianthus annuus]|nr:hypothetical protein HanIR_Chr16g0823941 [Helianthus annuus]